MKKVIVLFVVLCLLFAGCANSQKPAAENTEPAEDKVSDAAAKDSEEKEAAEEVAEAETEEAATEEAEAEETEAEEAETEEAETENAEEARVIVPLPDPTMENLTDAILSVSLEAGGVYVDSDGAMKMDLSVFTYIKYDMVDISMLKVGDTIVTYDGEVEVTSMEQDEAGTIYINGGLDEGGFNLATDDSGIFYEQGYNDTKSWYEAGTATLPVSEQFEFVDSADLDQGEVVYSGSALIDEVTNYHFAPNNTTVRVEAGQIVEMNRVYTP